MENNNNNEKHLVFVYGTLKYGHSNHIRFLGHSTYVGDAVTMDDSYQMYSHGYFPMVIDCKDEGHNKISGEIYEVDNHTRKNLDLLESNGKLYTRQVREFMLNVDGTQVPVEAWIYLYNVDFHDELDADYFFQQLYVNKSLDKDSKPLLSWNR